MIFIQSVALLTQNILLRIVKYVALSFKLFGFRKLPTVYTP